MDSSMTTQAHYSKVNKSIILPIPIDMMNLKFNITSLACNAFVWKIVEGYFKIKFVAIFIVRIVLAYIFPFKSLGILSCKTFIFTLSTAISAMFSSTWSKISRFSTILTDHRNFFFLITFMKTRKRTIKLATAFPWVYNKFFRAVQAIRIC